MQLFCIAVANLLGIISGLYFKIGIVLFVMFVIVFCLLKRKNRYLKVFCKKKDIIIVLLFYLVSFMQINILEESFNNKYKNISGEINVVGTIISNPIDKEYKQVYTIKIDKINNSNYYKNTKLLLNIKKNTNKYSYGDKISFTAEFEQANSQRNKGGFNYREYLKTKGIYGIVTNSQNQTKLVKKNNVNILDKLINDVSTIIEKKIFSLVEKENANILTALLIGNKNNLEDDVKDIFKQSSLSHILAISGAHVSYVIMLVSFIISKTKINKRLGKIITIVFLVFFMMLTGSSPSVTRACIMAIYTILGSLLHKKVNVLSSISISSIIILLINPYSILDIGMQLSYAGTIGIVFIYPIIRKIEGKKQFGTKILIQKIKDILLITISANIIIIPIIMYHFSTISFTFLISNLLASPFMGILIILGFSTIIFSFIFSPLGKILASLLNFFTSLFLKVATFSSNLPFSQLYIPTPKIYQIIIYYILIITAVLYIKIKRKQKKRLFEKKIIIRIRTINKKKIAIVLVLVVLFNLVYKFIPKNLNIYFVDVGQGDCTLITTPQGKNVLIDGGGSENFDVGEKTLLPYLLDRQITTLDYVIISHFDTDHVGGILTILKELNVKKVIIGTQYEHNENFKEFTKIVNEKRIKVNVVEAGSKISIEKNLYFDILWPDNNEKISENSINNNALVFKMNYNNFSMLFTGDIEEEAEKILINKYKNTNKLESTILKVGHHGSKTSSTQEFLKLVEPKIALIGVGAKNTFGHPSEEVLQRLENLNCKIYRTDKDGEIKCSFGTFIKVTSVSLEK